MLQNGTHPRARLRIYVGRSPYHSGSVALVLNPKTGLISSQFHVVFDDNFSTLLHLRSRTVPPNWAKIVQNSSQKSVEGFHDVTKTWFEGVDDITANEYPSSNPQTPDLADQAPHQPTASHKSIDSQPPPTVITQESKQNFNTVSFEDFSQMLSIIDLASAGLR